MTLTQNTKSGIVKMVFGLFFVAAFAVMSGQHAAALSLDLQVPVVQPVVNAVTTPVNALLSPVVSGSSVTVTVPSTPATPDPITIAPAPTPATPAPTPVSSTSSSTPSSSSSTISSARTTRNTVITSTQPTSRTPTIAVLGAQPLSLPFTTQGGILSRNLGSFGLTTSASPYGEQAPNGMIQQSDRGWIIFGVAWYWYALAGAVLWLIMREVRKLLVRRPRRQIPVEFL